MKITNRNTTLQLSDKDVDRLSEELGDIGFLTDDMSGRKQPDEKWPALSELYELLMGEK